MTLSLDFSARQAASGACPLDEQRLCDLILTSGSSGTRITSYNVCYTKLLRNVPD